MNPSLKSIRYNSSKLSLSNWNLIKVTGADRENFFQGQITSDLTALNIQQAHLSARLNRQGKLQSFFFIARMKDCLYLLTPKELQTSIIEDFSKYIIMEDVTLEVDVREAWLILNPELSEKKTSSNEFFELNFYGIPSLVCFQDDWDLLSTNELELERVRMLNGWPCWNKDTDQTHFINETMLGELAISYSKGCFLGQETAAKIENNRGAYYYPMLIEINQGCDLKFERGETLFCIDQSELRAFAKIFYQIDHMLWVKVAREYRVEGKSIVIQLRDKVYTGSLRSLPHYKASTPKEIARELFHLGVQWFQEGDSKEAMLAFERSIKFDSSFADPYESIGVILGREEKYQEAIEWMDKLHAINPNSVLAHTNKSLYLMKLGKIEEAEAEKSLATVKTFAHFGEEAKIKKAISEEARKKEEEMQKREKMFLQVLEIDSEDVIALYGLADIYFFRKNFEGARQHLEQVIALDSKYSVAYLLLGKCLEALTQKEQAIKIYQAGISVASRAGEMKPANEMQARLNQLVMGASSL